MVPEEYYYYMERIFMTYDRFGDEKLFTNEHKYLEHDNSFLEKKDDNILFWECITKKRLFKK